MLSAPLTVFNSARQRKIRKVHLWKKSHENDIHYSDSWKSSTGCSIQPKTGFVEGVVQSDLGSLVVTW